MSLVIVGLPLLSAAVSGFCGKQLGREGSSFIATSAMFCTALLSYCSLYSLLSTGKPEYITLFTWMEAEALIVQWGFMFDSLASVMLVVVTTVSAFVHLYSIEYMSTDPHRSRFMSYLSLFTFFMIVLVTSDNFVLFFMGWEGVGLCSYLLVNFWHTRVLANQAALKAVLVNKLGDMALLFAMLLLFLLLKTLDFVSIFSMVGPLLDGSGVAYIHPVENSSTSAPSFITVISFFIFIGCVGKSAQLGLHTWLPDAMEGPTPVSALIHAATMVTAGVFLLLRCSFIIEFTSSILFIIAVVGALTAFVSATIGLVQNDLKRVIAYSTCSQLGYMVLACGLSQYSLSIFHLSNHAFFKALLFLGAGSIIHAVADEQDIRRMGSLVNFLPFTYAAMLVGSLALAGFPFLTGFYSKDAILESAFSLFTFDGHVAYWLGSFAALGTSFYSFRLLVLVFLSRSNGFRTVFANVTHESPLPITAPLFLLTMASIFIGWFTHDMFIGLGTPFWGNALIGHLQLSSIDYEFIPFTAKALPTIFSVIGGSVAIFFYGMRPVDDYAIRRLHRLLTKKYYFDTIYNVYIIQSFLYAGYHVTLQFIDRGFLEVVGPFGAATFTLRAIVRIRSISSGMIYQYAFFILFALWVLFTLMLLSFLAGETSSYESRPDVIATALFIIFMITASW